MSKKIFIGNLDFKIDSEKLNEMFSEFGDIEDAIVITDRNTRRSKGFGFVTFSDDSAAEKAISEMNEKEIDGRKLTVNEAEEKEDNRRDSRREHNNRDEKSNTYYTTKEL